MPRIRTIKPEIWLSPQVMNLKRDARLLFLGMITQADDEGRGVADPRKMKAAIFPGDDDILAADILKMRDEIESQGLAQFYEANGHGRVYALTSWRSHQYVERPKASLYPPPLPTLFPDHSPQTRGTGGEAEGIAPRGSDPIRKDSDRDLTRAGASGEQTVDKSRGPRRADLKKPTDPEEIEARRRGAAQIAAGLAAAAKA